ncbi:MAG TPA: sensor histidine kinase [Candidatus Dormibacteraeota bacterium]|nr:sensor histidine kinase [Candidatus Dormibacteraeota bacterium]
MTMTLLDEERATSPATETEAEPRVAPRRPRGLLRRVLHNEVVRFAAGGLLAACLVGAGTFMVVSRDAENQAVGHAKDITQVEGVGIVQPALSDSLLSRDVASIAALDRIVRQRILSGDLVRVKLWSAAGTVIYSDEPRLIGRRFTLGSAELASLRSGTVDAGVSDLTDAENQYERSFGKLLQVYLRVHTPAGVPLLFETYQRYQAITQYQQSVWASFLPVLIIGLATLLVVQIPLAVGMARRLRTSLAEREALLERAINASEQERRRIARDLHDGVVQRLAAVTFSLSALARRLTFGSRRDSAPPSALSDVTHAAGETRAAMRDLRTLIVEIAPPNLHAEGIDNALRDLLEPLSQSGVRVSLEAPHDIALPAAATTLLFRVAQEALRNAGKHAESRHVDVRLENHGTGVQLVISDDGRGFSAEDLDRQRRDGHVGLSLLRDLVADAGGALHVDSHPGAGTRVSVEVPC